MRQQETERFLWVRRDSLRAAVLTAEGGHLSLPWALTFFCPAADRGAFNFILQPPPEFLS